MYYDYFSKTIQRRGKQYFEQNRVFSLEGKDNRYSALILGTQPYHTTLTLNAKGNIAKASCDCPYAQDGYRCKHEAALYYALEERLMQNNSQFFDVKQVFNKYRRTTYNDFMLNNRFIKDFNEYIKTITLLHNKNQLDITNYQKVLDNLVEIAYPSGYKKKLIEKAFNTYKKLIKNKDKENTISWLERCFVDKNYLLYKNKLLDILGLLEVNNQIDILKSALLKTKNDELFDNYMNIVKKNNLDIYNCLNGLEKYKSHDRYNYEIIKDLVKKGQVDKANEMYQRLLKNKMIKNEFYQVQIEAMVISEKKDSFFKYMLKRCDYLHYESVILHYRELENFYGNEWEIYKDKFFEYVKKYCDSVDFYYVLIMTNNVKLLIYELMEMPDFDIFCNYQNHIKEFDKESYLFLYVDCLLNKVQYIKSAKDYDELNYNIRKLFDDVNDQLVKQEIAQLFVEKYPKRKKIKEIFDRYLSLEDKEYEYKYSCY